MKNDKFIDKNGAGLETFPSSGYFSLFLLFLFEAGLFFLAAGLGYFLGISPIRQIHWERAAFFQGTAAAIPLLGLYAVTLCFPFCPFQKMNQYSDDFVRLYFRRDILSIFLALFIALAAGGGEEALFRGLLQTKITQFLGETFAGKFAALFIASFFFGLGHALTKTYALLTFLVGLYFGGLLLFFENLLIPIAAHALYDFTVILFILWIKKPIPHGNFPKDEGKIKEENAEKRDCEF